ncbi:hypothetical protein NGK65_04975 [Serratia ureilytica]|uniref:hypothetical protein n=1 Tax=Serratia TaxID=613 RepID=UPI002DB68B00|nr:hypothetical protein [Serratia ureilytica]MEB7893083.1 hypothetical protein [Serratia ureilytica]
MNEINYLAAAYCASEFSLAEQRYNRVTKNPYTESIAKRSMLLAENLATFLEENGYQIILYTHSNQEKEPKTLLNKDSDLFSRGDVYFSRTSGAGIIIAPNNFENNLNSIIEPNKDGIRIMAGMFDNNESFKELTNQVNMAKHNLLKHLD